MLASINPLGERARGTKFRRTFGWYLAGSTAGGAVMGALAGLLGLGLYALVEPSTTAVALVVAIACAVGIVLDLRVGGARLPSIRRQVNENWLTRYRGWLYGGGFGFQLGLGVVTIVTTSAVYVLVLLEILTGSVLAGALVGMAFGVTRALPLLVVGTVDEPGDLRRAMRRANELAPVADGIARVSVVALAVTGLVAFSIGGAA